MKQNISVNPQLIKRIFYQVVSFITIASLLAPYVEPVVANASQKQNLLIRDEIIRNGKKTSYEWRDSVTASGMVLENGAGATIRSRNSITLKPGFKSSSGSVFKAIAGDDYKKSLALDLDTDSDGLPDHWEKKYGLDSRNRDDFLGDPDRDGFSNAEEMARGTDPNISDIRTRESVKSLPSVSGKTAGYTAGSFTVGQSGEASYSIPIAVPPGTSGMRPKLSLSYNSRGGNGVVGVGWSLGGLSSITRCPSTIVQDGFSDGIDFDSNDKLCLNGQRLVPVRGNYGVNGTQYKTETESFSKIIAYGNLNSGGTWFKVWTKDGLIYEYAGTSDSRIEAQGKSAVLTRNVNKISDTLGNYMTIHYSEDNSNGESYPTRINYTGNNNIGLNTYNRVDFIYKNRPDQVVKYVAGSSIKNTKLLSKIKTYSSTSLVKEYKLDYEYIKVVNDSYLKSLRECDKNGICFSPVEFEWKYWHDTTVVSSPDNNVSQLDFGIQSDSSNGASSSKSFNFREQIHGYKSIALPNKTSAVSGNSFNAGNFLNTLNSSSANFSSNTSGIGYNQTDICSDISRKYGECDGPENYNTIQYPDINGDGKADLTFLSDKKGIQIFLSNGKNFHHVKSTYICDNGSVKTSGVCNDDGPKNFNKIHYPDINGDGKADLVFRSDKGGVQIFLSNGKTFIHNTSTGICSYLSRKKYGECDGPENYNTIQYPDINGDGKADLTFLSDKKGIQIFLSNGKNFHHVKSTYICDNGSVKTSGVCNDDGPKNFNKIHYPDINGDGKADLVFRSDKGGVQIFLSNGKTFIHNTSTGICSYLSRKKYGECDGPENYNTIQYPDINGDGKADLTFLSDKKGIQIFLSNGKNFHHVKSTYICNNGSVKTSGVCNDDGPKNFNKIHYPDINGDGKSDLVFRGDEGIQTFLSNGKIFSIESHTSTDICANSSQKYGICDDGDNHNTIQYPDINGDGLPDLVFRSDSGIVTILEKRRIPGLINVFKNAGVETRVNYEPITNNSVYTKGNTATYPQKDMQTPLYVVSEYDTDNGVGGRAKVSYKYKDVKVGLDGRGLTSFKEVEITNHQIGTIAKTEYHQNFPLNGKLKKTEVRLKNSGQLISKNTQTWKYKNKGHNRYFLYPESSISENYENASLYAKSTTTNKYDDYGNVVELKILTDDGYSQTTTNTYKNNTDKWILGRLENSSVKFSHPDGSIGQRKSSFEYDGNNGLLKKEITDPGGKGELTKKYSYDTYGNIVMTETSGKDIRSSIQVSSYDSRGQFVLSSSNTLGHTERKEYDKAFGLVTKTTGPNGISTRWEYDGFGRSTKEIRADNTQARISRIVCDNSNSCPAGAVYFVRTDSSGAVPSIEYYDKLDRVIRTETISFGGEKVFVDTTYNEKGQKVKVSKSYFYGEIPLLIEYKYDSLGRITTITNPDGGQIKKQYNGRKTISTNQLGQKRTEILNSQGKPVSSTDDNGGSNKFSYDAFGNLIKLEDAKGNDIVMEYDNLGKKTKLIDPSLGKVSYKYNALGELISQTDSNGNISYMSYDLLGRIVKRVEKEGITRWIYDTKKKGKGKIGKVIAPDGYEENYTYDYLGRSTRTNKKIDGQFFSYSSLYDVYGRVSETIYPTGFTTKNIYNNRGYLKQVENAKTTNNKIYWKADSYDSEGKLTKQNLGNGISTNWKYDYKTGFLETIDTYSGSVLNKIQSLEYEFDKISNLKSRKDKIQDLTENFTYDNLNRLKTSQVLGQIKKEIGYDEVGNIIRRSDVGQYRYGENGASPYAVTSINGVKANRYIYDKNGNRISSSDGNIKYTSFDKPYEIVRGNNTIKFSYGPTRGRYKRENRINSYTTNLTTYVSGLYQREESGITKYKHYIASGNGVIGEYIIEDENNNKISFKTTYLLKDHLSSIDKILDSSGNILESLSFDAWGKRRNSDWTDTIQKIKSELNRGFTGHEQLDEVGLVHMNGRVYDPEIGRFLSADPFIQAPESTQSVNRYTYVMNNPLSLVDPSGFFREDFWKILGTIVVIALSIYTGGAVAGLFTKGSLLGAVVGGAVGGFVGGFGGALVNGANLNQALQAGLNGALSGAISGGLFHQVGNAFDSGGVFGKLTGATRYGAKVIAHGVAGGLVEMASGGKFDHGFYSTAFSQIFSPLVDGIDSKNRGISFQRASISAIIGGTAAELGGGKFGNGALSTAFARMYNDDSHRRRYSDEKARRKLGRNGINVNKTVAEGTSLEGIRESTVDGITEFQDGYVKQGGTDTVVVTGGTEGGHATGKYSHANGYKLDIRTRGKSDLNSYIENSFTSIGIRPDGAVGYEGPNGNKYWRESNHWDIDFSGR